MATKSFIARGEARADRRGCTTSSQVQGYSRCLSTISLLILELPSFKQIQSIHICDKPRITMKVLKDQQIQSTDNIVNQNEDNIIGYFSVLNERMQKS